MLSNSENLPLVSIIIPCYNHELFIQESIQSVINQDYKKIELIIIDDGSCDESVKKIKETIPDSLARFEHFEFRQRENKGLSATLNEGINLARGSIISFCSSDDTLHHSKISTQVKFFLKNEESDFCYTSTYIVDDNSQVLQDATKLANKNLSSKVTFKDILTFKVHFPVTGAYRANFLKYKLRGFDEALSAEDYDINLKIIRNTKIGFINEKLYYYRSPAAIGTKRKRPVMRRDVSESHRKTIEKYRESEYYNLAILEWNYRRFIYFCSYRKTKIYAINGMMHSISKFYTIQYLKACARLLLQWK